MRALRYGQSGGEKDNRVIVKDMTSPQKNKPPSMIVLSFACSRRVDVMGCVSLC